MGKTPILQLETSNSTTDASQKFLTYRMNQNGDINSNMTKIDGWADTVNKKVKELQDRVSTVLLNANWVSLGYYEATTLEITELKANMLFTIRLNKDNDGTTTIKVNGLTTKSLLKCDSSGLLVNLVSGDLKKNKEYQFRYDGTSFIWQSGVSGDQVNVNGVSGDIITISADNTIEDSGIKAEQINTNKDTIGNKETLKTAEKSNLVGAINEVEGKRVILSEDIGNKANLQTDDKTNLVSAINEVKLQSNEIATVELPKKANREQESWNTLTLKNGWSGELKCYLDTVGILRIKGTVSGGVTTDGTVIGTLPPGYLSTESNAISGTTLLNNGKSGVYQPIDVFTNGNISISSKDSLFFIVLNTSYRKD